MPQDRRPTLMVVEDEPAISELLCTRLEIAGYRVFAARDGLDALARVGDIRPAGIVLDINMPRLDGFGVLEGLRKRPSTAAIPTLVLTARNNTEDVRRAVSLGARDYLAKPFEDAKLLARVKRLLHRRPETAAA